MKRIKLQHFTAPDKSSIYTKQRQYKVSLGNGTIKYFTDKKSMSGFINETNIFLNEKLNQLNFIYIESFGLYRIAWFYFESHKSNSQVDLVKLNNSTDMSLVQINKAFESAVKRSYSPNKNHFVFRDLNLIIDNLQALLSSLQELYRFKSHTDKVYKIDFLLSQLHVIKKQLKIYPENEELLGKKLEKLMSEIRS